MQQLKTYLVLALLSVSFSTASGQCELYDVDFLANQTSTSQYNVTCGGVSGAAWTVIDDTCEFYSTSVDLGGTLGNLVTTPISVKVNPSGNLADCDDYIIIQYRIDSVSWVTQDSINACDSSFTNSVTSYDFNVTCGDTSALEVRVIMAVGGQGKTAQKMRISDGGLCISSPITVLPIELKSFTALIQANDILIEWITISEKNNSYFTVERSVDGVEFDNIAEISGAGFSNTEIKYNVTDDSAPYGTIYYRLKQTDEDGSSETSEVIVVQNDIKSADFAVFPNPTIGKDINVSLPIGNSEEFLVALYDPMGKVVFSRVILTENEDGFNAAIDNQFNLNPGIYLVVGSTKDQLHHQKLVISEQSGTQDYMIHFLVASR